MNIFLATKNPNKLREIGSLLAATGYTVLPAEQVGPHPTEVEFLANLRKQARLHALNHCGLTVFEKSGLEIPAIGNLPGPWSARFADAVVDPSGWRITGYAPTVRTRQEMSVANMARVLGLLKDVVQPYRAASLIAALLVTDESGRIVFETQARTYGWIADEPRGTNGFGYDPIFIGQDTAGYTYGELDAVRKNLRSHRSRAIQEFCAWLGSYARQ